MAAMNSSVLACNYATGGASTEAIRKAASTPLVAPTAASRSLVIRVRMGKSAESKAVKAGDAGRRLALLGLAAAVFATASSAKASVFDEYLERSKANKELNDKKRLATSGANFYRAYTVEFGTCKFPENFTGCQDLAKQKKVPFISEDLALECEGKDKFKCGSNVFWKW
ncbi:hypothetical protein QJS10_CPA08g01021 [Acorus calamus]|uniref:Photosystem I reaction center subunit N, chloroplastic n=1 Tax=Acorus calamus TaxID=4465 RepID=A0AAV9EB67_ACOCL|nr:hypothetical protein QJS10_CPA08g01021 [Acorus calamus]